MELPDISGLLRFYSIPKYRFQIPMHSFFPVFPGTANPPRPPYHPLRHLHHLRHLGRLPSLLLQSLLRLHLQLLVSLNLAISTFKRDRFCLILKRNLMPLDSAVPLNDYSTCLTNIVGHSWRDCLILAEEKISFDITKLKLKTMDPTKALCSLSSLLNCGMVVSLNPTYL